MSDIHLPKGDEFWIVFDKSNGDLESKRYLWWFDSKKEALDFLKDCKERGVTVSYSRVKRVQFKKERKKNEKRTKCNPLPSDFPYGPTPAHRKRKGV